MTEKELDKLVDQVTERIILQILSGRGVCYECGERSIKERLEKLEQEAAKRRPIVDDVEVVRCMDCKNYWTDSYTKAGYCDFWKKYIDSEKFFCAAGERREE